jgi:hypothetical protein
MFKKSAEANPNYLAKVFQIDKIEKHPNADSLQIVTVDMQPVITGMTAKKGDVYVYFPVESQLSHEFVSFSNGYREATLNKDQDVKGFFEEKRRVRAVKLRQMYSFGYIVPLNELVRFAEHIGVDMTNQGVDKEFDCIGDHVLVKKFFVPPPVQRFKQGKSPRISRLVENQVRLHVDTENLRKNAFKLSPNDHVTISYKTHGTSWWVANLLTKENLSLKDRVARYFGANIKDTKYDLVYGSRKVVKNEYESQGIDNFYDADIWKEIKDEIGEKIPKGFTVYGEALGYLSSGSAIQSKYDYGCEARTRKLQVYRVTFTNVDGEVFELPWEQVNYFCNSRGLDTIHVMWSGKCKDKYPISPEHEHWIEDFVNALEKEYTEKDCFMCKNVVPEEGIVVRVSSHIFEAYKLKSFKFLDFETAELDKGLENIEA